MKEELIKNIESMRKTLSREPAIYVRTESEFYSSLKRAEEIGFNKAVDKVIDFIGLHFSKDEPN